jgi:hypothetical protein
MYRVPAVRLCCGREEPVWLNQSRGSLINIPYHDKKDKKKEKSGGPMLVLFRY